MLVFVFVVCCVLIVLVFLGVAICIFVDTRLLFVLLFVVLFVRLFSFGANCKYFVGYDVFFVVMRMAFRVRCLFLVVVHVLALFGARCGSLFVACCSLVGFRCLLFVVCCVFLFDGLVLFVVRFCV